MEVLLPVVVQLILQPFYLVGLPQRQLGRPAQPDQRIGSDEAGLQVGQGFDAQVVSGGDGLLLDSQGDEKAQLGDLGGNHLDVHTEDTVLDEVKLASEVESRYLSKVSLISASRSSRSCWVAAS